MSEVATRPPPSPPWAVPEACAPWPPSPQVVEVRDALLTAHERLQQSVDGRRSVRLRGAVHDAEGWVVPQSQRVVHPSDRNVPSDPVRISPRPSDLERLTGQWYYLGHWMWQFGHFLFETLPVLWAHQGESLVAHRFGGNDPAAGWQRRFLELAGVSGTPYVIDDVPVAVEKIRVPKRPTVVGASASPAAVSIWQKIARAAAEGPDLPQGQGRQIALSRSRLEADRPRRNAKARAVTNASALDDLWRRYGFEVVHPELLSLDEQIRVIRGAKVLVGLNGSAPHASAFARPGTPVILVGNPARQGRNLTQKAIDAAVGNPQMVIGWKGVSPESQEIDLDDHARKLDRALASLPGH